MPTIRKMCFGKKPAPAPAEMTISAPISIPFDYERNPLPPWQNAYSTHLPHPVPVPPPKTYDAKYGYGNEPKPVPVFDSNWRWSEAQKKDTARGSVKSPLSPSKKWWVPTSGRGRLFRNAGLDGHGRLKLDYEDLEDADWGAPEYVDGGGRKGSIW